MPIQLAIYSDILEIRNPGGLYGRLTIDMLGKVQPDTRNPVIATALEILDIIENRYSGIPTIRREMKEYGLPEPEFTDNRGEFTVIFRLQENIVIPENINKSEQLLIFCQKPRSRKKIAEFLGLSSISYAIKRYVEPLVDNGRIGLKVEGKLSSPNQLFFTK